MPNISTSPAGLSGFGGFLSGLTDLATAVAPIVSPFINRAIGPTQQLQLPSALPGGAPIPGSFADPRFQQAGFFGDAGDFFMGGGLLGLGAGGGGQAVATTGQFCVSPRPSMGMRLPSRVDVPRADAAGNITFVTYKNMGRPLLYQGDLAATKRVRKIAGRARRAGGR